MPEITQNTSIKITPEKFLDACSLMELTELDLLLSMPRYQNKLKSFAVGGENAPNRISMFKYTCTFCHENEVDADNGFDTCTDCLAKM